MTENKFTKNNYDVIEQAISKELSSFVYTYFQNKRAVAKVLHDTRFISPFDDTWGTWTDAQIPGTYSHYGDLVMETLMTRTLPLMKKTTALNLIPCYTYARLYKFGDELKRHKDRPSCEISCTLNLGGDEWPIFLEPSGEEGEKGIKVNLNPGDMLVYKGTMLEHWREPFQGYDCGQVFMHYNDENGEFGTSNINDRRPMLGLPSWFKK
tara:strand:- start:638 stop:1264 length:627 start_codon:yes stop_codon:yes gene_type:complete